MGAVVEFLHVNPVLRASAHAHFHPAYVAEFASLRIGSRLEMENAENSQRSGYLESLGTHKVNATVAVARATMVMQCTGQ